jgi:7-cyano-7-deazaguanine synthase
MGAVILLSAGLDSTVAMADFLRTSPGGIALTFDYGQRAAAQELSRAEKLANIYGLEQSRVSLPFLAQLTNTSLVNREAEVPQVDSQDLDKVLQVTLDSAEKVWVPNRNGLFINIAAVFAESLGYEYIIAGFNAEEAVTFPDNSPQFIKATNQALAFSTLNQVKVVSPTQNLNKMEIVQRGKDLGIPWQYLWSCYHGDERMCGGCESCQRMKRALESQGLTDILQELFQ